MAERLNVACIGLGGMLNHLLKEITASSELKVIALCDVDENRIVETRKGFGARLAEARAYRDYRALLEAETSVDAVVIATPDHWHPPICKAAMLAGKHIYCEKPLTRTIAEARELREMARRTGVVTQTGNQGSASENMRRCVELIEAGVFGQIREVQAWHGRHGWPSGVDRLRDADPVPAGLDWDFWLGPAPARPYNAEIYHPFNWRGWYDFGSGSLGDFCCHMFNLPVRALKLDYPVKIEISGEEMGRETYPSSCSVRLNFAQRPGLAPLAISFFSGDKKPPEQVTADLVVSDGKAPDHGCMLLGDKGSLCVGLWNADGRMKMKGETKFKNVADHEAAQAVPRTLPRVKSHMQEWIDACNGGPKVYSDFEIGGQITEIGLAGVLALRLGCDIDWDGPTMKAYGHPEAGRLVKPEYRKEWRF